ncbi:MAG: hypothetical protein C0592_11955 [Marinilabiliales bacterium]|nr:MAG: hypothetical protein C0592_11955 [Marinilabiliales bacterium]
MKWYLFILFAILSFCFPEIAAAQSVGETGNEPGFIYRREYNIYGKIHTEGWGIGFRWGQNNTVNSQRYIDFHINNMKHPKEIRTSNSFYFEDARSYVYGKQYYLLMARLGFGSMRVLNEKPYWGGIDLRHFWSIGPTIAMAKPIYLYVIDDSSYLYSYYLRLEKYNPGVHNTSNIYGRGPFFKGIGESKFYPGLTFSTGLSFEFGNEKTSVRFLEVGATADLFFKSIPIMAYNENEQYFITFYLSYHFGRRYNK